MGKIGIALGSWGGGHLVEQVGLAGMPFAAAIVVVGGIALPRLSGRLDRGPGAGFLAE